MTMIHDWWLRRTWIDNETSFVPLKDELGRQKYAKPLSSLYRSEFGQITKKNLKFAELLALTIGSTPPATTGLINDQIGSRTYGNLTVAGPGGTIYLTPLQESWFQYTNVASSLVDPILDIWEHAVTFRSVAVKYSEGTYSELDPPDVLPIEE